MATSTTYNRAFWNVMKGKEENNQNLSEGFDNVGAYVAPDEFREGFNTALAKENVFRRFATVINLSSAEGKIQAVSSTGTADWVEDGDPIPESADTFTQFLVKSYKLASLVKLNRSFVTDMNFNLEKYLMGDFAKRFGKAEENALLNGNGTTQPTGILTVDADVTTADSATISFDEIISLYFSLKDEYRNNATTKSDIGGTVYVVESRVSDSAKESAYSKLKRLITVNAKSLSKLSDSSNKSTDLA